ncbi:unnamed protein product, partial [Urochloa humidicola]
PPHAGVRRRRRRRGAGHRVVHAEPAQDAPTPAPGPTASLAAGRSLRPPPSLPLPQLYDAPPPLHTCAGSGPDGRFRPSPWWHGRAGRMCGVGWWPAHAAVTLDGRCMRPPRPAARRAKATCLAPALPVVRVGEDRGHDSDHSIRVEGQREEGEGGRHWWCCGCRPSCSCSPHAGKPSTRRGIDIHQAQEGSRKYKLIPTSYIEILGKRIQSCGNFLPVKDSD